ncbi:hypothetical protein AVEN_207526-1 [Araneus ventricosus]|uniref:STPR domain-containing protein n=1 Tax=Araneus ventricosus TaxID=182803 RepID=A0A4Y2LP58_ARAVE|nr:hypothetical protein AVEN_227744-1 [Araneus ventricosus]GBO34320.1 hypothetical protein AVEN_207526-1 [Araneus ventricosus]
MPKRKRGVTWDDARRQQAIRNVKGELLKLTKKETAYFQLWQKVARTEEQINSLLTVMAQRDQNRRAEETEEQRNRGLSHMAQRGLERKTEETEEQRNSRLSDMAQRRKERRAQEIRRTKEWSIVKTRRVT